jgi:ribonuclease P protein component
MDSVCVCEQNQGDWFSRRAVPRVERGFPRNAIPVSARPYRFLRSHRITKPAEYREIFKSSRRFTESNLILLSRRNRSDTARLGLALSNRWIQGSVSRNRIKRLIREYFRREKNRLKGLDIVVLARGDLHGLDNKQLTRLLERLWSKLEQCRESP